jgi:membrane protein YqaA with SNARE-associated domain
MPDDIAGIVGGVLKYDIKKFFTAVLIGKVIFHLFLAFAGHYGINGLVDYFLKNPTF